MVIKEDVGLHGRAKFAGKLFDSLESCFKDFPVIKYTYVPCLFVCLCLICLIVFMVHWGIAYSEPCQTSKMELFAKIVTSKVITLVFTFN